MSDKIIRIKLTRNVNPTTNIRNRYHHLLHSTHEEIGSEMLSTLSKVTMYIVFIYLFIIQKNISLLGRLCFLYLIPVVVVGVKQNAHVLWPQRGHLCQKGPVTMLCCPGLSYDSLVVGLGSRHVQPVPFPKTISI